MERTHAKYERLLEFCKTLSPMPTAVVHPCDEIPCEARSTPHA